MKGTDWLAFVGPILIALIAVFAPVFKTRSELRDKRSQIRADLELLELLPETLDARGVLMTSIDRRVRLLATSALPRVWRLDRPHRRRRIAYTWGMVVAAGLMLFSYVDAVWLSTTRGERIVSIIAFLGSTAVFLVLRWLRRNAEVKETTELYDEEMSQLQERNRQQTVRGEQLEARGRELVAELEAMRQFMNNPERPGTPPPAQSVPVRPSGDGETQAGSSLEGSATGPRPGPTNGGGDS
ncbi:hypothetical protein [Nocardia lijiangensis]|uniref:hypothetical protein n=1 Tax=Nocardia lijiangensis TaxID=299618 RepID=UPI000AB8F6CC|nr:hypothetical protein [Nocardia lijiangensis]